MCSLSYADCPHSVCLLSACCGRVDPFGRSKNANVLKPLCRIVIGGLGKCEIGIRFGIRRNTYTEINSNKLRCVLVIRCSQGAPRSLLRGSMFVLCDLLVSLYLYRDSHFMRFWLQCRISLSLFMTKLGWTIDDYTFVFYLISKISIGG